MKPKNPAAVALGRLAKGKRKNYGPEEIKRRTERIRAAKRHPKKASYVAEFFAVKPGTKIITRTGKPSGSMTIKLDS